MTPLQRFYLPYYVRTSVVGMIRKTDKYQLLSAADRQQRARAVIEADVQEGFTPQADGKPLPLALSPAARASGLVFLYRGARMSYFNKPLHDYLQHFVYDGGTLATMLRWPALLGLSALLLQL